MAAKKRPTPPSCDYEPIPGEVKDISFGVVEAVGDPPRRLEDVIGKRWFPTERPAIYGATGQKLLLRSQIFCSQEERRTISARFANCARLTT